MGTFHLNAVERAIALPFSFTMYSSCTAVLVRGVEDLRYVSAYFMQSLDLLSTKTFPLARL